MPESEPMSWHLPHTTHAAGLARQYLDESVAEVGAEVLDVAQLLVTELVTNALRHGSEPVTMTVVNGSSGLRISVSDAEDQLPRKQTPSVHDLGGRGLQIVDALAAAWGTLPSPARGGKTVWFELTSPSVRPSSG